MFFTLQIMFFHKYSQPGRRYISEQSNEIKIIVTLIIVSPKSQRTHTDTDLGFLIRGTC